MPIPRQLADLAATACSPDGLVRVTAGALGDLRELHLDPRHHRTQDADALGGTILATVRAAADNAARTSDGTAPPDAVDLLFDPVLRAFDDQRPVAP
ncbi:YbaB/EbfC family nucleoid-associated protein [Saccharothrix luteola]|uniref:YbaB/EbfC family nucleoid-associated protein n=1 Tax=Saccharothrix luteola TaxID=2893018 RepID=UPI001E37AC76|nr:YbaB/EbfC family nucleoid-associated protein [Saccharothrix luteola]MCC8246414.1 YbaB/EbfC family nucleoid-associated protein [Saccharothrix luteola]